MSTEYSEPGNHSFMGKCTYIYFQSGKNIQIKWNSEIFLFCIFSSIWIKGFQEDFVFEYISAFGGSLQFADVYSVVQMVSIKYISSLCLEDKQIENISDEIM